ncbi:FHA domain-containing protein [bacterium]|nr:FHA domain-containing protein [bacterium]
MIQRFELRNPERGIKIKLAGEFLRVGRAEDNEIVLKDASISRHHLNIYIKEGRVLVEDAGSRTGFFVNGRAQRGSVALKKGDTLKVGNQVFEFFSGIAKQEPKPKTNPGFDPNAFEKPPTEHSGRLKLYLGAGVVLLFALMFMADDGAKKNIPMVQDLNPTADGVQRGIDAADLAATKAIPKSLSEIEAEGKFQEGLREYHNGNFVRAIKFFNDALTQNPNMEKAEDYLQFADSRLQNKIKLLMEDGQRSFSLLQYPRAKAQFAQVLSILSEQIPGYWQRVAQKTLNKQDGQRSPAQEETLLDIPCEETKLEAKCKLSVELIKQSRILLGEEDNLK